MSSPSSNLSPVKKPLLHHPQATPQQQPPAGVEGDGASASSASGVNEMKSSNGTAINNSTKSDGSNKRYINRFDMSSLQQTLHTRSILSEPLAGMDQVFRTTSSNKNSTCTPYHFKNMSERMQGSSAFSATSYGLLPERQEEKKACIEDKRKLILYDEGLHLTQRIAANTL